MGELYEHPDTGEQVEIPDGADVQHVGDPVPAGHVGGVGAEGEILHWRMPPHTPAGELHPAQDPQQPYEPRFDRGSGFRRVLMSITDEVDVSALGPRNSIPALAYFLARNPDSPHVNKPSSTLVKLLQGAELGLAEDATAEGQVRRYLAALADAGLVAEREDGSYELTDAGRHELRN